jgi:hypothetical protein
MPRHGEGQSYARVEMGARHVAQRVNQYQDYETVAGCNAFECYRAAFVRRDYGCAWTAYDQK